MNNAKEIAEKLILQNSTVLNHELAELARAYLDAAKELDTTKAALSESERNNQIQKDIIIRYDSMLFVDFSIEAKKVNEVMGIKSDLDKQNDEIQRYKKVILKYREELDNDVIIATNLKSEIAKLKEENERLKKIIAKELNENDEFGAEFVMINILKNDNEKLKKSRDVLRKAVEKYANPETHSMDGNGTIWYGDYFDYETAIEAIRADDEIFETKEIK